MSNFRLGSTRIGPSVLWILVAKQPKAFQRRMHGGCHCCHSEAVSFVVSLFVLWHQYRKLNQRRFSYSSIYTWPTSNKERAIQWLPPCTPSWKCLAIENPENRRAYSSAFSSKIWYSRVISVFLGWCLTWIWYVLWGKLSFNSSKLYFSLMHVILFELNPCCAYMQC